MTKIKAMSCVADFDVFPFFVSLLLKLLNIQMMIYDIKWIM